MTRKLIPIALFFLTVAALGHGRTTEETFIGVGARYCPIYIFAMQL